MVSRARPKHPSHHPSFPLQMFLGLLFTLAGGGLLASKLGLLPISIPQDIFLYVCGFGSLLGGLYLIIAKIHKPRIYL